VRRTDGLRAWLLRARGFRSRPDPRRAHAVERRGQGRAPGRDGGCQAGGSLECARYSPSRWTVARVEVG